MSAHCDTPLRYSGVAILTLLAVAVALSGCTGRNQPQASANAKEKGEYAHTNRLIDETSPYLLQHAHNPVDWYPWGPEAFAKAKKEGKPVFLSIGYSSCHWCHVMEKESFEDEGIAALLNEHFVAIKVDREERPDLDEIYMAAVQMMTGGGGWPMSTFLTPEGKPFHGGTYFPRQQFSELLRRVHEVWSDPEQHQSVLEQADLVARRIGEVTATVPTAGTVSPKSIAPAVQRTLDTYDPQHGGFGGAPKFPPSVKLALMLSQQRKKPNAELKKAITHTLDRMARGGLYDQVGGGFHRYSTDEKWLVPHFEKMLYDNALLSWVYLLAYQDTKDDYYRRVATETLEFVLRELRDEAGGFWSTLDADSEVEGGEKEEGAFYVWKPGQVIAVLGDKDGKLFNRVYDIERGGNFEGESIPNLISKSVAQQAKELKMTPEALWKRLDPMRAKLLEARAKRIRPALDDKVLANWNGLMIRSFALAYDVTGEPRYREAAEAASDFILTKMRTKEGRLLHSYRKGKTQPIAFLEDYSYFIVGLATLHRATGDERWLKEAHALTEVMVTDFWDEEKGAFFFTAKKSETLLARSASAEDNATPSGQSMAALALVRLSRLSDDNALRQKARRLLNTYATPMRRFPQAMSNMLYAAQIYFTPDDARPSIAKGEGHVRVTVTGRQVNIMPGQTLELTVSLRVVKGWHINSDQPKGPRLKATKVTLAPGPFELVSASYPKATTVKLSFSKEPLSVFEGTALIKLKVKALPGAEKATELRLRVTYQACNDKVCERPVERLATLPLVSK